MDGEYSKFLQKALIMTRPKPAYGTQRLGWDHWAGSFVGFLNVLHRADPMGTIWMGSEVSETGLFLTLGPGTSNARNENLRPLLNRHIPLISGKYGLRNHF